MENLRENPWEHEKIIGKPWEHGGLTSGKLLHDYGLNHPSLMGKLTLPMAIVNSYVKSPEGKFS